MTTSVWTHFALETGKKGLIHWRLRVLGCVALFVIVMVIIGFMFQDIDRHLERNRTVESDNRTWVVAELEVDALRLQTALLSAVVAQGDHASLEQVRLDYDILYSRVDLISKAATLEDLPIKHSLGWRRLAGPDGFLPTMQPLVDGDDAGLRAALPELADEVAHLTQPVRETVIEGFSWAVRQSDDGRADLRNSLYWFLIALGVIMIALTLLLITIYTQSQTHVRHRKMLELALFNLRNTIEASHDAVLIIDSRDRVIGSNEAGRNMLGRRVTPAEPMKLEDLLMNDREPIPSGIRHQTIARREDGSQLPVEVTLAPAHTVNGSTYTIAFLRDMSDQLERENRLAEALHAARRGEETKDRFLAVMSHEMRTPLNGLISAVDLLESTGDLDEHQSWLMEIIRTCARTTLEQVNNVLELTRLAARDGHDYPEADFDLPAVIDQIVQQYHVFAIDQGNTLELDVTGVSTRILRAPVQLLRRITNNLLSNAIKFTRDGGVRIEVRSRPLATQGMCEVVLIVRDSGIGICAENLERIFHNFETLDNSYSRIQEGSGLGLGIAKLAAEAMGGTITVESELGRGSTFTVSFRAAIAQMKPSAQELSPPPLSIHGPLNILLAEDNELNRMLLERQLIRLGHDVTPVCDGAEAIAAARRRSFDIVLMDVAMPRMDGLTASRILRDEGVLGAARIIALTAQAEPKRVQQFRDAGMDEVVTKPANIALLNQLMQQMVADATATAPAQAAPEEVIDRDMIGQTLDAVGMEFLHDMVGRFRGDMDAALRDLDLAVQEADRSAMRDVAHKAGGGAAVMGCVSLQAALNDLENTAGTAEQADLVAKCLRIAELSRVSIAMLEETLAV